MNLRPPAAEQAPVLLTDFCGKYCYGNQPCSFGAVGVEFPWKPHPLQLCSSLLWKNLLKSRKKNLIFTLYSPYSSDHRWACSELTADQLHKKTCVGVSGQLKLYKERNAAEAAVEQAADSWVYGGTRERTVRRWHESKEQTGSSLATSAGPQRFTASQELLMSCTWSSSVGPQQFVNTSVFITTQM